MVALKRFQHSGPSFADLVPYAGLVDNGIMLLKDGSLMAGFPHLYYYSDPRSALEFVKRCAAYRDAKEPEQDDAGRPARYPSDAHHAVPDPLIGVA